MKEKAAETPTRSRYSVFVKKKRENIEGTSCLVHGRSE